MTFERKKKLIIYPLKLLLIKSISLLLFAIILNIIIWLFIPSEKYNILFSTLILLFSLGFTTYFEYEKDMKHQRYIQELYKRVEDDFFNVIIQTFAFLRLPRKAYLNLNNDTIYPDWKREFFNEFKNIRRNFLFDSNLKYTEKIRKELSENIIDGTLLSFKKNYELRKIKPIDILNRLTTSPYFIKIDAQDQEEILAIKSKLDELITSIDKSVNKNKKQREKDARKDTLFTCMYIRYLILSWYILYYKANLYHSLSWKDIKTAMDKISFDDQPL